MPGSVVLRVPANYRKPVRPRRYRVARSRRTGDMPMPVGRSGFHQVISRIPGGPYYTVAQVAWIVEVDPKTVKQWIKKGKIPRASFYTEISGSMVYLYTDDDVERIREYAENH